MLVILIGIKWHPHTAVAMPVGGDANHLTSQKSLQPHVASCNRRNLAYSLVYDAPMRVSDPIPGHCV